MSNEDKSNYYRQGTDVYVEGKNRPTVIVCSCVNIVWANFIIKRLTTEVEDEQA